MKDIHGQAILDYHSGKSDTTLLIHTNYDPDHPEEMPVEAFFRDEMDLTVLENLALIECTGKILDLGAGAGAISLILQENDFNVFALENSPGCIQVMKEKGVKNYLHQDFRKHTGKYDTILVLMNGLGLARRLKRVPDFLIKCASMLNPDGQILVDSSDINYLYESGIPKPSGYYGEVKYQYEYQGQKGDWFRWVYVDQKTLERVVKNTGLEVEIIYIDQNDQFLARIVHSKK